MAEGRSRSLPPVLRAPRGRTGRRRSLTLGLATQLQQAVGSDVAAAGQVRYYCPLSSRRLYSVDVAALADPGGEAAETVADLGPKPMADGLESDDKGRVYGGDLEYNAIWRRTPDGVIETLAQGRDLVWVDTLSVASDRLLYAIANQLNRQPDFHESHDLRRKPYLLLRVPIDAGPVRLR
ncbi:L-dopachrome tautomerase-related protein [Nonomuraea sp. 3N208]|uniref:L-dopachrome tautomerase-related protein n=1 Tax=Nonomuraea sp. 3N208 TaxID=3457421 RepID=UPI003FD2394E